MPDFSQPTNEEIMLRINELTERVDKFEKDPITLGVGIDTRGNIEDIVDSFLGDKVFNINWDEYFYYSSLADEDITRYDILGNSKAIIGANGITMATPATGSGATGVELRVTNASNVMRFDRETRFRFVFDIDNVANTTLIARTVQDDDGHYVGFQVTNGAMTGTTRDGTTESTVSLGTYTVDQDVNLELRFVPGKSVHYYFRGRNSARTELRGVLRTNLPTGGTGDKHLVQFRLTESTTTEFTANVPYWEFAQKR